MKKLLLILAVIFSLTTFANDNVPESVHFENGNFFAITTGFNQNLLDNFTEKVLSYKGKELYIYFDTPGGSVIALSQMARIMKSSDIKFTCVANFAASAGFMLFEHCDTRLLMSDGQLMSHNWSGGFRDEAPRILTLFYTIQAIVDQLEGEVLSKLNVDKVKYYELINKNLWMTQALAKKYEAIDGVISKVTCDKDLIKKRVATRIQYFTGFGFASKYVYKSGCPLIQKTYAKKKKRNKDKYEETEYRLFDLAQKNYKLENANMIYLGNKNGSK